MSAENNFNNQPSREPSESLTYHEVNYSMGWLLPLLLIVLTGGLVLFFMRGCNDASIPGLQEEVMADTVKTAVVPANGTARKTLSIRLADSTQITAYKNGIENQLVLFITSKEAADSISKNRWFDFDDLNFKTGSAAITDSSMRQIKNIAAILKAYPAVKIKIGGYTDKTGNEAANMQLSRERAEAVITALKDAGVNAAQLTGAEGYGSQYAKAAAGAADEEKQKDRRISINVRAK